MTATILATILTTGLTVGSAGESGLLAGAPAREAGTRAVPALGTAPRPLVEPAYRAPLAGPPHVLRPFSPPAERYGRGHLGLDLAAPAGAPVLAAGAGVVRFAGPVAGRPVVVLAHPDGISTEYEPVTAAVVPGQRVVAGQRIGTVRGAHRGCAPATCLHWGARRGEAYLDPMSLLRPLGLVRLLPWR